MTTFFCCECQRHKDISLLAKEVKKKVGKYCQCKTCNDKTVKNTLNVNVHKSDWKRKNYLSGKNGKYFVEVDRNS